MANIPPYQGPVFANAGILDAVQHYRAIRDLGPVVRLSGSELFAVGRYDDVRAVLADHDRFVPGEGVLLNDVANELTWGTTLASDPPLHDRLRTVVAHRLTSRALRGERDAIRAKAEALVARVLELGIVDGVADIAQAMSLSVVPNFRGFPKKCRPHLLTGQGGGRGQERRSAARAPRGPPAPVDGGRRTPPTGRREVSPTFSSRSQ